MGAVPSPLSTVLAAQSAHTRAPLADVYSTQAREARSRRLRKATAAHAAGRLKNTTAAARMCTTKPAVGLPGGRELPGGKPFSPGSAEKMPAVASPAPTR